MIRNQYLKQIMHATKLANKRLLISFKKYKHLKMRITLTFWVKNIFMFKKKILSTPVLKGTGVLKKFHKLSWQVVVSKRLHSYCFLEWLFNEIHYKL